MLDVLWEPQVGCVLPLQAVSAGCGGGDQFNSMSASPLPHSSSVVSETSSLSSQCHLHDG